MSDLIRKSDALAAAKGFIGAETAIAALPAVTVGVKPLVWSQTYNNAGDLTDVWCADDPLFEHRWWAERADKIPKIEAKRTARILAALEPVAAPDLTDPVVVHANMLRGTIAKPTVEQIIHLYGVDALVAALAPVIVREAGIEPVAAPMQYRDAGPSESAVYDRTGLPPVTVAAPRRYMGQIMAECNCSRQGECEAAQRCLAVAASDPAAIREAWEKAYWRIRSYAVHDNDCKLNKPPRFDGPCSCGLTAALEEALALIDKQRSCDEGESYE